MTSMTYDKKHPDMSLWVSREPPGHQEQIYFSSNKSISDVFIPKNLKSKDSSSVQSVLY